MNAPSQPSPSLPDLQRIPQLDGIRGIAILMVLVWHYLSCAVTGEATRSVRLASKLFGFTWSGVDLFFVLSGFLITGILLRVKDAPNVFTTFYARRAFRILPLYILLLASYVAACTLTPLATDLRFEPLFEHPLPLWAYASFTQNILMGMEGGWGPHWIAVTWSLAVEEQFYLVAPFLVVLLPRRILVTLTLAGITLAPMLRWLNPGFHAFVNTPWRLDSLLMGSLLALCIQDPRFQTAVARHHRALVAIWLLLAAIAGTIMLRWGGFTTQPHFLLSLVYSLGILLALHQRSSHASQTLAAPALVWLGARSYAIYLCHEPVNGLLHGFIFGHRPQIATLGDAGVTLLSLAVTLALAAASFQWLEQPLLRLSRRFQYRPAAPISSP